MNFCEKIKLVRTSSNLTQEAMAASLGVGRTTYTNIERGAAKPTTLFINCLCALYGLDKASLLDDSLELAVPGGDLSGLIEQKFHQLDDKYKAFVLKQIDDLLELQRS